MKWRQISITSESVESGGVGPMLAEFQRLREASPSLAYFHYIGDNSRLVFPPIQSSELAEFLDKYNAVEIEKPDAKSLYVASGGRSAESFLED